MGASFRSTDQILALAGCDLLTISPELLDELSTLETQVVQQLSTDMPFEPMNKVSLTAQSFSDAYEKDSITQTLLPKGIDGFIHARDELAEALNVLTRKS